jgi:hypothetical protein
MPTIELTDEQAEELRDLVAKEAGFLAESLGTDEVLGKLILPDYAEDRHRMLVLQDILELLEIA